MQFSFIHAADIHLDSPLKGLARYEGAPVGRLRSATREAFTNLVNLAIEKSVRFIIIAGDLYDGEWKDYNTGLFFAKEMARLQACNILVYLIKGNHDAASIISRELKLPSNVYVFDSRRSETVILEEGQIALHGQSFSTRAVIENLAKEYPEPIPGFFNIGILHTSATGREGHENYAPCSVDELKGKGYDYWALGHIHMRELLCQDPPILFPGNIQARHSKEAGPKGCTLIQVHDGEITQLEHQPLDVLRWDVLEIDVSMVDMYDDLLRKIEEQMESSYIAADGRMLAIRTVLVGNTKLHGKLLKNKDGLLNDIRSIAFGVGQGDIWIEKVKVLTASQLEGKDDTESNNSSIHMVTDWLNQVDMKELLDEVSAELLGVINILPTDLKQTHQGFDLNLDRFLDTRMGSIKELIMERLSDPKKELTER